MTAFEFGKYYPASVVLEFAPDLYLNACFTAENSIKGMFFVLHEVCLCESGTIRIRFRAGRLGSSRLRKEVYETQSDIRRYDFSSLKQGTARELLARMNEGAEKAREADAIIAQLCQTMAPDRRRRSATR